MKTWRSFSHSHEAVGLAAGSLLLLAAPFQLAMLQMPGWLLLALTSVSSFAAFAIALAFVREAAEPRKVVRQSVGAAGIAAAVGSACFAWLAQRFPGMAFRAWLPGLLSILPSMFCGMLTAGVAALTLSDHSPSARTSAAVVPLPKYAAWSIRCAMALLLLLGLGVIDIASKPVPLVQVQPRPLAPVLPPETFSVSKEMSLAQAAQWRLSKSRAVQGITAGAYALSADDRWLAATTQDRQALRVLDLHTFDAGRTIRLGRPVDRLSFDPLARRVIAVCDASPAQLAVIDVQRGTTVSLPMPRKRAVPEGSLLWWKEHEVLIGTCEKDLRILDLETLEVDAASALRSWQETKLAEQDRIIQGMTLGLRETARWKWEVVHSVEATELPEVQGDQGWPLSFGSSLGITHPEQNFSLSFPQVAFREGDHFWSSRDGSKVFRARGSALDIFYFDISPAPHLRWTLDMPHEVGQCGKAEEAKEGLEASRLCAFVYEPLRNPLNGRVVGPRREGVKALLTFESWSGKKAEVYVSDLYSPIDAGDVVADPCLWDDAAAELLALDTPHRWWAKLPPPLPGSADLSFLPMRKSVTAKMEPRQEAERMAGEPLAQAPPSSLPSSATVLPRKGIEDRIRDFVTTHHIAAKVGDVERLVMDYADQVDYFNSGWVDRESIRRDELKYHGENAVLEQRILGMIGVTPSTSSVHAVTYELQVTTRNRASGQATTFTFEVSLQVIETPHGLKIERQRAVRQP